MILTFLFWLLKLTLCLSPILYYVRIKALFKSLKSVPGPPANFLIGYIPTILGIYRRAKNMNRHPGVFLAERIIGNSILYRETGMYSLWYGLDPMVNVFKAEIMELILTSSISIAKSREYDFMQPWLGTGLLTSTGQKWKHRRKLLTPSFHFRILEDFLPVFHEQSLELVDRLRNISDNEYVDIVPLISLCTLDVICETAMGVSVEAQKGNNVEYIRAIQNHADVFNRRLVRPWLWYDLMFQFTDLGKKFRKDLDILHNFSKKVIKEKKDKLLSGNNAMEFTEDNYNIKQRRNFMDLLLDMHLKGEQLSVEDIREEVDTFMFEGHDTTAMAIIFALYLIGLHPEVQRKVSEELDAIFGGDAKRCPTYDDTRKMKYLECVLKESQRLYPSVPIIGRKLSEDIFYGNMKVPKNTTIRLSILSLHKDPKVFPNPEVFDPERFLPENTVGRHPYAYIPFSAGPRNCIGQKFAMLEEKVIVSNILRNFTIISRDPRDKFHIKIEFTLRPDEKVMLKFLAKF